MSQDARPRVKFASPPVMEVVCGVAFSLPRAMRTADVGKFWGQIDGSFPTLQEVAPLPPVIENLSEFQQPVLGAEFVDMPPLRRSWFISPDGRFLAQLQDDRFIFNWRRLPEDGAEVYPGFEAVMEGFWGGWEKFAAFAASGDLGAPTILQAEVTYINALEHATGFDVGALLTDHQVHQDSSRFLPLPERINWQTSYRLPDDQGRLHVVAQTAMKTSTREPLVRLELTARGLPLDCSDEGLKRWQWLGHDWVTHGFADVTSAAAQTHLWKRSL
ncbi:MAG: TIGR04255 family protein [Burkholderiales bacterium]|nr:TIGR04255 family protein [Burkholderiales bacterium]